MSVDALERVLVGSTEQSAVTHKALVVFLCEATLHWGQTELVGIVVHCLDAIEECEIHIHLVAVGCNHRRKFLCQSLHFRGGVAFVESHKHIVHFAEHFAAHVESEHSVVEIGTRTLLHNSINLCVVLLDAFFQSWNVVLDFDFSNGGIPY